jgi:WD40 repeat protein
LFSIDAVDISVANLAYSADGQRLAGVQMDNTVKIWDANTGREVVTMKCNWANPVAFSPDGKLLASPYNVWDAHTGQEIRSLQNEGPDSFDSVSFRPDGKRLATGSWSGTVRIFDVETGQQVRRFVGGGGSVAFSPDGKRIASDSDNLIKIWDADKDPEFTAFQVPRSNRLTLSFDWSQFAYIAPDKTMKIGDLQTQQEKLTLKGQDNLVNRIEFSLDGKRLATGAGGLRWPSGRTSIDRQGRAQLRVWDTQSGDELFALPVSGGMVFGLDFSSDGRRLVTSSGNQMDWSSQVTKIWNAQTGKELLELKAPIDGMGQGNVVFSPDGELVARCGRDFLFVWNANTGELLFSVEESEPHQVTFTPDSQRLAAAIGKTAKIWDARTGRELLRLRGHNRGVRNIAFHPHGKRLATTSADDTLKLWDTESGAELLTIADAGARATFSPDGHRLAVHRPEGLMKIYDATPLPEKP